jgi:methionine-R-sulfoxide reductase
MWGMATDQSTDPDTDREWAEELSDEEYRILREAGTEPAGTSDLLHVSEEGVFKCSGCGQELYTTDEKFDSGTGWPSFWAPADTDAVRRQSDPGLLGMRTEIVCDNCDGHLGHVFNDGPEPTGERHCINGKVLDLDSE